MTNQVGSRGREGLSGNPLEGDGQKERNLSIEKISDIQ